MRSLALTLAIIALATTAAALPPPEPPSISRITPRSGPPGTLVTIEGRLFGTGATVSFGDVTVKPDEVSDTRIVVRAPYPAAYGPNDVTVRAPRGVAFAKNGFRYSSSNFDDIWAPVLVPLWLDGPTSGARGSTWSTELWLRNGADAPVTIIPWACGNVYYCFTQRVLAPSESLRNLPPGPPRSPNFTPNDDPIPPARVLYISRDDAPNVQARLRLRETKSGTVTDLPTIRESDLRGTIDIVGVPVATNARTTLRIYGVGDVFDVVDVYVLPQHEGADDAIALAAQRVIVSAPFSLSEAFTAYPGYAEVDLSPLLVAAKDAVHIAIVPAFNTVPPRFWAMVSITDNDTQRVTLATP